MKIRFEFKKKIYPVIALILAVSFLMPGCSGKPKATPAPTSPVGISEGSFADGTGETLGFKMLYALDGSGGNGLLGTSGIVECLAAIKDGAAGDTDTSLADSLGMQGMTPKDIDDKALHLRTAVEKLKQGAFTTAWSLFMGDREYVKESYITKTKQSLQLDVLPFPQQPDGDAADKFLGEWADDSTGGKVKTVNFTMPTASAPFFVDILTADTDWPQALDSGKTRPLPFTYEDGSSKAVPTMVCVQSCGLYSGADGSMAILPTSGDETRLVVMVPPDGMSLHDFFPVAAAKHDEWLGKAVWANQRVLLPRFKLGFEGSVKTILQKSGLSALLAKEPDYSNLGDGLYFSDILHKSSLIVDESGVAPADPNAEYHQGIKDSIPTLAIDQPFIILLEKTDTGQVLMMGFVRDPLAAAINPEGT